MTRHGKARPGEARRGQTRRRPDKKVSPGFENYCIMTKICAIRWVSICWNTDVLVHVWCQTTECIFYCMPYFNWVLASGSNKDFICLIYQYLITIFILWNIYLHAKHTRKNFNQHCVLQRSSIISANTSHSLSSSSLSQMRLTYVIMYPHH